MDYGTQVQYPPLTWAFHDLQGWYIPPPPNGDFTANRTSEADTVPILPVLFNINQQQPHIEQANISVVYWNNVRELGSLELSTVCRSLDGWSVCEKTFLCQQIPSPSIEYAVSCRQGFSFSTYGTRVPAVE